jgi:kynureninase
MTDLHPDPTTDRHERRAADLDAADPLREMREEFIDPGPDVVAYFDGNSLGRPLRGSAGRLDEFVRRQWAGRLIRGWTDSWLGWPELAGDLIGRVALGAAPGQVVVADSTTVLLYKLARAAVDARPGRSEILLDTDNFPTDRYVLEGIAAERGLELRWITPELDSGVTVEQVRATVGPRTALVVLSHVAYRSAYIADGAGITAAVHDAGALMLWDLSHSGGSVPVALDEWGADLAVGCTYKYLNGGPGAPAYGYVRAEHHGTLQQPVWGWMGRREIFDMAPGYEPAPGIRNVISGTPPILAMVPLMESLELLDRVGIAAVRTKSLLLTGFALDLVDDWLGPAGVALLSPRDPDRRGGHITLQRPGFREVLDQLWERGVIADYRRPDGIRIGLSPLSTSFAEVYLGMRVLRDLVSSASTSPSPAGS